MSEWIYQKTLSNGDPNPGNLASFGVVPGEQLLLFLNAAVTSMAGAAATAIFTLVASDQSGNSSSVALPPLNLAVDPSSVNGMVAAPVAINPTFPTPGNPAPYFTVAVQVAWTGTVGDGEVTITATKK